MRRKISARFDGDERTVKRAQTVSEDPHRRERKFFLNEKCSELSEKDEADDKRNWGKNETCSELSEIERPHLTQERWNKIGVQWCI